MAQTKTRSKPKPKTKAQSKPQSKQKPKTKARPSRSKARKTNTTRKSNSTKSNSTKSNAMSKPRAMVETVEETAKDAGHAVGNAAGKAGHAVGKAGHAVGKAKVPLMAGGAALAGVAGGMALGNRQSHRHRGLKSSLNRSFKGGIKGLDSDDLAKAARKVGDFSAQIGELAIEARRIREESNGKASRSPIEVVLDGLTARRGAGRR